MNTIKFGLFITIVLLTLVLFHQVNGQTTNYNMDFINELKKIVDYCSAHPDSPNAARELGDKGILKYDHEVDSRDCSSIRWEYEWYQVQMGGWVGFKDEYYMQDLYALKAYCFEHANRAATGENVGNDLVNAGLVNSTFYNWSCSAVQEELKNQADLEARSR